MMSTKSITSIRKTLSLPKLFVRCMYPHTRLDRTPSSCRYHVQNWCIVLYLYFTLDTYLDVAF